MINDGVASATTRGIGMAASVAGDVVRAAARAAQESGYHSFWLNNPPGGDALAKLGAFGPAVSGMWLGVGVIPLSHQQPSEIAVDVRRYGIPLDRFYLGIGSGGGTGGVERVRAGIRELRGELECTLVAGALGPRMCRLAGREADAVLLNWVTPQYARTSAEWIREAAGDAGRAAPRIMAYVRSALGDEAMAALGREASRYESIPQYAAHFERMGVAGIDTAVVGSTPQALEQGLTAWDGVVDEVVVRAITANDTADEVLRLLEAAQPGS